MNHLIRVFALALLLASNAQASLLIRSIEVAMVQTQYDSRAIPGSRPDQLAFDDAMASGFLPYFGNSETLLCATTIASFSAVSPYTTCAGSGRDIGTRFAISGAATSTTEVQLGLDWGRGGFAVLTMAGLAPQLTRLTTGVWWQLDWNSSDVLSIIIPETTDFLLVGLGFEDCCYGENSARWRAVGADVFSAFSTFSAGGTDGWQTLTVNVPEPGVMYLLGLGLAGFAFTRRAGRPGGSARGVVAAAL